MKKNQNIWFKFSIFALFLNGLGFVNQSFASTDEFLYSGDRGPAHWRELNPDWEQCAGTANNAHQSPIDIEKTEFDPSLKPLELKTFATPIHIINNGHTIEQEYENNGSSVVFEGKKYVLQQFHFHTLSEHEIVEARGSLELHAVFTEPGSGDHLVVGMLYDIGNKENAFIQTLIEPGLPEKSGDIIATDTLINLADALTNTASYYTYAGSLTTPPCSENVTWVVLKNTAKLSHEQWEPFRALLGNNFRPLQKLNHRTVRVTQDKHQRRIN